MLKKWWHNQWERYYELKEKEKQEKDTRCPNCDSVNLEKDLDYSWKWYLVAVVLVVVGWIWFTTLLVVGFIIGIYQSMKITKSTASGDKHICQDCGHDWIGKGIGKKHKVVG